MLLKKIVIVLTILTGIIGLNAQSLPFKSISNVDGQFRVLYNPSLLASEKENGFLFVYDNGTFLDDDAQEFTFALNFRNFGFAYNNYNKKEGTYFLVSAHKILDGVYFGNTFRWYDYGSKDLEYDISLTTRAMKYISFAVVGKDIFGANNTKIPVTIGLGFRPMTN